MSTEVQTLAKKVTQLSAADRAYLAECLLASLDETEIQEQWAEEAERRADEIRSGEVKPIPADEVYRRIDELLQK